jgi:hypothetical protein
MRNHFDNINGVAALSFVGALATGMTIQDWAASAALLYSAILIV